MKKTNILLLNNECWCIITDNEVIVVFNGIAEKYNVTSLITEFNEKEH